MLAFGLALAGVVTLWLPAFAYRIDAVTCGGWPSLHAGALYGLAYAAGVALLAVAWLRAIGGDASAGRASSLGRVLLLGACVHAAAMVAPPFASNDPLYYAAIGRAMARYHASPTLPLSSVLPAHDRFLEALPPTWRDGTSPYGPAFNALAATVARLGGDDLLVQLKLYQLLGALALMLTAATVGYASGPRAAALVLFCPAAIVDGTMNPHNDALVAPWVALFALALARRRELPALAAAAGAIAFKLSGALLLGFLLLRLALRPLVPRLTPRRLVAAGAVAAALAVAALVVAIRRVPSLYAFAALVGDPHEAAPHFARSLEALPRAYLFYVAGRPLAAWMVGLGFRAAAGVWLLYAAFRAARDEAPLPWSATALFVYYLFFHAFAQTWYLIPLLALASQLPPRLLPPFKAYLVGSSLYYAIAIPLDCDARGVVIGAKELADAAIVFLPAFFLTLRALRRSPGRASAGTSPPAA